MHLGHRKAQHEVVGPDNARGPCDAGASSWPVSVDSEISFSMRKQHEITEQMDFPKILSFLANQTFQSTG